MNPSLGYLRTSALDLFAAARDLREFEVAYHARCAALHAAESVGDPALCEQVQQKANECRETVDAAGERHKLSTEAAAMRGHESVFKQLAVMAAAARLRMEAEQKRKGHPKAPFGENNVA